MVLQQAPGSGGAGQGSSAHGGAQRFQLGDRVAACQRVFELASDETQVDQPLCADCAAEVQRELEEQLAEARSEAAAYAALGRRLEEEAAQGSGAGGPGPEEAEFRRELRRAQEEARAEQ